MTSNDGILRHARLDLEGSQLIGSSGTGAFPPMPCILHLFVDHVDEVHDRAFVAGARSLQEPTDQFYGDRVAGVEDPWGNRWWLATHVEDVDDAELDRRERRFRGAEPST